MKTNLTTAVATLAALAGAATFAVAQSSTVAHTTSPFVGTWAGRLNDLPGIDLQIEETGGKLGGTIVFYFQERPDANSPWRVTAEYPVPLLALRVEGRALTFEVLHHKCHTCAELGPNARFRVEVAGPDELRLWKLDDRQPGEDPGSGLKLTRQTGTAATATVHANSPFAGTWTGKLNDHPGIDLTIVEPGGKIGGTAVFYVQERDDAGSLVRVTAEDPIPVLLAHVEGSSLLFEVQPPCHDCAERGPNVTFRMEIAGPDEARLWKLADGESRGLVLKLTRRTEPAASADLSNRQRPLLALELRLAVGGELVPAFFRAFRFTLP